MRYYDIEVAGTKRALKLCPINQDLCIAAFLILGDTELTVNCAAALLERAPKYDFLLTAEAKSIPLVQEMARQNGDAHYIVARKGRKLYMDNPISVGVKSITTEKDQKLYVDKEEMFRVFMSFQPLQLFHQPSELCVRIISSTLRLLIH